MLFNYVSIPSLKIGEINFDVSMDKLGSIIFDIYKMKSNIIFQLKKSVLMEIHYMGYFARK